MRLCFTDSYSLFRFAARNTLGYFTSICVIGNEWFHMNFDVFCLLKFCRYTSVISKEIQSVSRYRISVPLRGVHYVLIDDLKKALTYRNILIVLLMSPPHSFESKFNARPALT